LHGSLAEIHSCQQTETFHFSANYKNINIQISV
jgi:hypothetical protein